MADNQKPMRWHVNDYRLFFDGKAVADFDSNMTQDALLELEALLNRETKE